MNAIHILIPGILLLASCGHSKKADQPANTAITPPADTAEQYPSFFPVTNYIKGQIIDIQRTGINPLKYITQKEHTDSVWIRTAQLTNEF